MCVVIDANKAADFCRQERPYLKTLMSWINSGGRIVSGGKLEAELFKVGAMRSLLTEWSRRGTLIKISTERVQATEQRVRPMCTSDDPHVVALAIESRASVIVTEDKLLIGDLRNLTLVGQRRRIFKENSASPAKVRHLQTLLRNSDCP